MKRRRRKIIRSERHINVSAFPYWFHGSLALLWWVLLAGLVLKVDPEIVANVGWQESFLPFYVLIVLGTGWLVGLVRKQILKGLWWGLLLGIFLLLLHMGLGSWFNAILLMSLGLMAEWYWRLPNSTKSEKVDKESLHEHDKAMGMSNSLRK